ncbi:uncharacterized protein LOC129619835 [Bubalus kerabau]|uniref:uncharacterized protein LOC112587493 n=1 Tax=Bubalus bubalis TaxID=89462 RepID=UPI001D0FB572|nr:uncharacterized protein LOC112587493 [Bubalus bubalis]XP_055391243.1 uncharacterized protein LOC129619835 [Bubalus carabanensis]
MFRSGPLKCFPRRRRQSLWRLRLFFQHPALLPPRPPATPSQRRSRARGRRGKLPISLSARGLRGQAWVRAQTGPCHFQKKGKPGRRRASSSVDICEGSSRAATATFGVRKHQVSRAARKPRPARSSPPCSHCCHLDSFPPSLKSFKNTSGREEGRAHRVTGREKGSAWPSSEADPESPARRSTRSQLRRLPRFLPLRDEGGGRTIPRGPGAR